MHELNIEVWTATEQGRASRDFDFRNEIRDAADSAERNVAEGFGRYKPLVFANFLDFSRAEGCRPSRNFSDTCGHLRAKRNAELRYAKNRASRRRKNGPNDPSR